MTAGASDVPLVTIVVPVWRDTAALRRLLSARRDPRDEWLVVNGDPGDRSLNPLRRAHPDVGWLASAPGRGTQIATGATRARGDWLLVLHADTTLPADWRRAVTQAAAAASHDWGCFELTIASPAWQARLIEFAVRWRVRCFRLPYGDQAMFFRRTTLERLGGVPSVPLMEDVMLARRFGRLSAPYRSRLRVSTSARRWTQDGWWRRTARNVWILTRFLLGVSPERLATAYTADGVANPGRATMGRRRC